LENLGLFKEYPSIIDVDTCLFGLTYQIIFKKNNIDISKKDEINEKINEKITYFKSNTSHQKSPNNLGHLRNRISQSIEVYREYIVHESQ